MPSAAVGTPVAGNTPTSHTWYWIIGIGVVVAVGIALVLGLGLGLGLKKAPETNPASEGNAPTPTTTTTTGTPETKPPSEGNAPTPTTTTTTTITTSTATANSRSERLVVMLNATKSAYKLEMRGSITLQGPGEPPLEVLMTRTDPPALVVRPSQRYEAQYKAPLVTVILEPEEEHSPDVDWRAKTVLRALVVVVLFENDTKTIRILVRSGASSLALESIPEEFSGVDIEKDGRYLWHMGTDRVSVDKRMGAIAIPMIFMTPDGTRFLRMNAATSALETVPMAEVESPDHLWVVYIPAAE
jgi:hypothetical protein